MFLEEKFQRRLADEIDLLCLQLAVANGDRSAIGDDFHGRRFRIFKAQLSRFGNVEFSFGATAIDSHLNEVRRHEFGGVEIIVGHLDGDLRVDPLRRGFRLFLFWRRLFFGRRRFLRLGYATCRDDKQEREKTTQSAIHDRSFSYFWTPMGNEENEECRKMTLWTFCGPDATRL